MSEKLQKISVELTQKNIRDAIKKFKDMEQLIAPYTLMMGEIKKITSRKERDAAHKALSDVKREINIFAKMRMETTRPLDILKKGIINYENEVVLPISIEMKRVEAAIIKFDNIAELKRLQMLADLEAERIEKEMLEKAETKRIADIKSAIAKMKSDLESSVFLSNSIEKINKAISNIEAIDIAKYDEFHNEARQVFSYLQGIAYTKKTQIEKAAEIEKQRQKAEKENRAARADLLRQEQILAEQRARVAAEQEKLKQQQIENQRAIANARVEADRIAKLERETEEGEIKKKMLVVQRVKGISYGISEIVVADISLVPTHLYSVKFKLNEIKKELRSGDIPGLKISFNSGLRLNA